MTSVLCSKVYALEVTCVNGEFDSAGSVDNLNGSSRITSIRRILVGGTAGVPTAQVYPPQSVANAYWSLIVRSDNANDDSSYEVEWVNDYIPSQLLTQGGLLAKAQFAP